jgi:AraC-like DNA-binding protein
LRERWPAVLPKYEGRTPSAAPDQGVGAWLLALTAFDELARYHDQDTLLRRATELLRTPIGLERTALFLLSPNQQRLCGTWGTGADGQTTDEHHIAFEIGPSHREAFALAQCGSAQWTRFTGVPLFAQTEHGTIVVRHGENIIIPIPGRHRSLGVVACDWALSGAQPNTDALVRAAVLTRILAVHLERTQVAHLNECATPEGVPPASPQEERIASRVAAELRIDPNLERSELSRRLGVTADRLGRAVKAALGEPLSDYRNRLRLQRYFAVVDPEGGNLLAAALDAGFGSYAQFHRVFRHIFGCSPIEHLRRTERGPGRDRTPPGHLPPRSGC